MTPVAGIIAEYNPLHAGHAYHIAQTRAALGGDCRIVAVISGHAVQRGEFPIMTKFARAEAALLAGADLVFELPLAKSLAGAERFARAGVSVLRSLGVITHLSFGSECGDIDILRGAADKTPEVYPKDKSLAYAYPEMYPELRGLFTPNNILGIEYLRALGGDCSITPLTVRRSGGGHDGESGCASAIRRKLLNGVMPDESEMPGFSLKILQREIKAGRAPIKLDEKALLSRLRRLAKEDFANLPEVNGGLHERLYASARKAGSWQELIALAKTRRFTAARLRRAFMCAFLGVTARDASAPPQTRLLGIGSGGTELLGRVTSPVISRAAAHQDALALESRATDQLALCMPRPIPSGLEYTAGIVRLE